MSGWSSGTVLYHKQKEVIRPRHTGGWGMALYALAMVICCIVLSGRAGEKDDSGGSLEIVIEISKKR